jgi:hypothetical protein
MAKVEMDKFSSSEDQREDFILTIEASMKVGLLRGLCWWIDEMLPLHHAQL